MRKRLISLIGGAPNIRAYSRLNWEGLFLWCSVRDNPEGDRFIAWQTALVRVGFPNWIGSALAKLTKGIASLLSPDNRWVNAQTIEVSSSQFL